MQKLQTGRKLKKQKHRVAASGFDQFEIERKPCLQYCTENRFRDVIQQLNLHLKLPLTTYQDTVDTLEP